MEYPRIFLRTPKFSGHPWVFRQHLENPDKVRNGTPADLYRKERGQDIFLARGHFNGHARVGFRILSQTAVDIDLVFFREKITNAFNMRRAIFYSDAKSMPEAFRLINSEGDHLSGLVIDCYRDLAVAQFYSSGMYRQREAIEQVVRELLPQIKEFYFFAERHVQKQESFDCRSPEIPQSRVIQEHGIKFNVDMNVCHKTGFYLDQRKNRKRLTNKFDGKTILDLCSFSGGFALSAKILGGAEKVVAVDNDLNAIELAKENARLNKTDIEFVCADMLLWCKEQFEKKSNYDAVILDPAKLARSREGLQKALNSYVNLNRAAISLLKPGGVFISCSCTGLVSEPEFHASLRKAASLASRNLKVFNTTGADIDHPWSIQCPESKYLKVVWGIVE